MIKPRFWLIRTGFPPLNAAVSEDGSAAMTWLEADSYRTWLGELAGIPLRLPTEDEWEFAARSSGMAVAVATDAGEFRAGINVQDNDRDTPKEPLGSFPANPLGLHDLVEGSYEWVSDTTTNDSDIRFAKGSSSASSSFFETIPGRYAVAPLQSNAIGLTGPRDALLTELGRVYRIQGTARCVAPVTLAPDRSGFGRAGGRFEKVPDAFGPYNLRNELME